MTICIAAIHEGPDGPAIVVASDRMITWANHTHFETPISKFFMVGDSIALVAGTSMIPDIRRAIESQLLEEALKDDGTLDNEKAMLIKKNVTLLSQVVRDGLMVYRNKVVQSMFLEPYGFDMEVVGNLITLPDERMNAFTRELLEKIRDHKLGVELILAGFDYHENNKIEARVFAINERDSFDATHIGFHAIGSGIYQSIPSLLNSRLTRNAPLNEIVYTIFRAKVEAEISTGVGHLTEMLILYPNGKVMYVDIQQLEQHYRKEQEMLLKHRKTFNLKLKKQ